MLKIVKRTSIEVLTEVSRSGLDWNVLQGSARCQPAPSFSPLQNYETLTFLPETTQFCFSRCIIHTQYIMIN
jgi:hypothetical protein